MTRRRTAILLIAGLIAATGCKRRAPVAVAPPTPTRVVATAPSTAPAPVATAAPLPAAFLINRQSFTFPPAKLVTRTKDDTLHVTLFSDDPPEAVREGYTGNSFYFRLTFDADANTATGDDLAGQQFVFRNSFTEQDDARSGLFIAGGRQTLRPLDASVTFDRLEKQLIVHIAGTFRLFDEQAAGDLPVTVRVDAELEPVVVETKK